MGLGYRPLLGLGDAGRPHGAGALINGIMYGTDQGIGKHALIKTKAGSIYLHKRRILRKGRIRIGLGLRHDQPGRTGFADARRAIDNHMLGVGPAQRRLQRPYAFLLPDDIIQAPGPGLLRKRHGQVNLPHLEKPATFPARIQAFGVFVDTLLVCSASAFIVLLSDGYTEGKLTGIELVQQSLSQHLGPWAPSFLAGMICLFAFSSIVGNYYYGEINIGFISKNYMTLMLFRVFVVGMVLFGSVAKVALVWDLADLFMALMAITNLVAIAILGKYAYIALHDYMDQKRAGIVEPEFEPAILPSQRGIEVWQKEVIQ